MVRKKVEIDLSGNDNQQESKQENKIDAIIKRLDTINTKPLPPSDVKKNPTIIDEYLDILKLRREIADTLFRHYVVKMLEDYNAGKEIDHAVMKEVLSIIALYLGVNDRWSNETLKAGVVNELGAYAGILSKIYPDYIGDPVAIYERRQIIGEKDETAVILSNLLTMLGINLSPETVDKLLQFLNKKEGGAQKNG